MQILYISNLSSKKVIDGIHLQSGMNPGFAVQKFSRLIAKGIAHNKTQITALSTPPINRKNSKKVWCQFKNEKEDDVIYNYIPVVNIPGAKNIVAFFNSFFYTLFWGFSKKKEKAVLFDVLNVSICLGGLLATKINGVQSVGIVTDMPDMMNSRQNSLRGSLISKFNRRYLKYFSKYVFLTEAMNDVINKKQRPYMVMEGLVDVDDFRSTNNGVKEQDDNSCFTLLYAGGLHERYGLGILVNAVKSINDNIALKLYGSGPFVEKLNVEKDERIKYLGVAPNEDICKEEKRVNLLVNPRPTHEDFTKYSFPSKNMEYMLSGTPLLTTKLPGMPKEYYPYVYLIEKESEEGIGDAIRKIMSLPQEEMIEKGAKAREFVLKYKNNNYQGSRILSLISKNKVL